MQCREWTCEFKSGLRIRMRSAVGMGGKKEISPGWFRGRWYLCRSGKEGEGSGMQSSQGVARNGSNVNGSSNIHQEELR
jgi:hypothetical protein